MSKYPKVAVIGLGNIGKTVAENLVKGNRSVILASSKLSDAEAFAAELGTLARAASTADAIKQADIIVFAVWFNVEQELFKQYFAELQGKIIIDPSNPIAPDDNGGFKKIVNENDSAGELNLALVPASATLVKAFGTLGAATLKTAAHQSAEKSVLFYATDNNDKDAAVEQLIADSGFEGLKIGGIDQSIRLEVFGDLHEFGAIGKAVNLSEAKSKI